MPVLPALGILFIALKLMGYIAWSWVWVLMPFWIIPIVVVLFIFLGLGTVLGIASLSK